MSRWKLRGPGGLLDADGLAGIQTWRATRGFVRIVLYRMFRIRAQGQEAMRREGAVIYAPVHRSHLDGPLVGSLTHRRVRYLGKEELFRRQPLGWFIRSLGTFPVRRGEADRSSPQRSAVRRSRNSRAFLAASAPSRKRRRWPPRWRRHFTRRTPNE